jgi:glycosyltransferase involved in cell wall biosynthesis
MAGSAVEIIVFTHAPFGKYLRGCLRSLLAQSYSSLQISLIGDDSPEVQSVAGEFGREPNIMLFSERELLDRSPVKKCRRAFLQAANVRMKESGAVYVGTWNCDDFYNRDHVKLLVDILEKYPTTGAAFNNVDYRDDWGDDECPIPGGIESTPNLMIPRNQAKLLAAGEVSLQALFVENLMTAPSSLVRRSVLERAGGYDKDTVLNCDLHWFYRIAAYFPVRFVNYTGVRKRIHPGNTTAVDSHHVFGVSDLENLRDYYPEVCDRIGKNVFNKKLGRKYFRLGLYYEKSGQFGNAQQAYKKAMQLRKLSLRYGWQYYRSTLFSTAVG